MIILKTFYKCVDCKRYTFQDDECPECHGEVKHPYPARFSLVKERKYRKLIRKYKR